MTNVMVYLIRSYKIFLTYSIIIKYRNKTYNIAIKIKFIYTPEDLKWNEFNKLKLYTTIEPDTKNVKPFIIINSFGIFLFSKSDLFMNNNDIEHK
jgi:hypothetical protein